MHKPIHDWKVIESHPWYPPPFPYMTVAFYYKCIRCLYETMPGEALPPGWDTECKWK